MKPLETFSKENCLERSLPALPIFFSFGGVVYEGGYGFRQLSGIVRIDYEACSAFFDEVVGAVGVF